MRPTRWTTFSSSTCAAGVEDAAGAGSGVARSAVAPRSVIARRLAAGGSRAAMIEGAILLGVGAYLAAQRPLREMVRALGVGHRIFLGGLFALLVAGHVLDHGRATFPFVPWNMYTRPETGPTTFREYRLRLASGREEMLTAYGSGVTLPVQMNHRLEALARDVRETAAGAETDPGPHEAALREFDRTLRALAADRTTRSPDDPVVAIEVVEVTIDGLVPPPGGTAAPSLRRARLRWIEVP